MSDGADTPGPISANWPFASTRCLSNNRSLGNNNITFPRVHHSWAHTGTQSPVSESRTHRDSFKRKAKQFRAEVCGANKSQVCSVFDVLYNRREIQPVCLSLSFSNKHTSEVTITSKMWNLKHTGWETTIHILNDYFTQSCFVKRIVWIWVLTPVKGQRETAPRLVWEFL